MKRETGNRRDKLFLLIGSIVLALAGLLLIGFQYRWIDQIARIEKERILGEMRMDTIRGLSAAEDEMRILISLFQSPFHPETERTPLEPEELIEKTAYWKEHASYPELLKALFIFKRGGRSGEKDPGFYRITEKDYAETEPPEALIPLLDDYPHRQLPDILKKINAEETGEFIFIPSKRIDGIIIYHIDLTVLFRDILGGYMEEYLPGYSFRILSSKKETIKATPSEKTITGEPELLLLIHSPLRLKDDMKLFGPNTPGGNPREGGPGFAPIHPLVEFWFNRTLKDIQPQPLEGGGDPLAYLEIYYPRGSIDKVVTARKAANLLVGTGILVILLLSLLVMNRLYLKTKQLQLREREFVTGVSHELRTPIAVIQSSSGNLARGLVENPEKVRKYGEAMEDQCRRLSRMVESILTFAGLSRGVIQEESIFNPAVLIDQIASELKTAAGKNGAEIKIEIAEVPESLRSFPRALRLVLENLLLNAFYHGKSEKGESPVFVRVSSDNGKKQFLLIMVEDRGPGIPAKEKETVFEAFRRGGGAEEAQQRGSGLGLHLIKEVLQEINGSIALESPYEDRHGLPRSGCRFTVSIPYRLPGGEGA